MYCIKRNLYKLMFLGAVAMLPFAMSGTLNAESVVSKVAEKSLIAGKDGHHGGHHGKHHGGHHGHHKHHGWHGNYGWNNYNWGYPSYYRGYSSYSTPYYYNSYSSPYYYNSYPSYNTYPSRGSGLYFNFGL